VEGTDLAKIDTGATFNISFNPLKHKREKIKWRTNEIMRLLVMGERIYDYEGSQAVLAHPAGNGRLERR
jgi:hypothetical protein